MHTGARLSRKFKPKASGQSYASSRVGSHLCRSSIFFQQRLRRWTVCPTCEAARCMRLSRRFSARVRRCAFAGLALDVVHRVTASSCARGAPMARCESRSPTTFRFSNGASPDGRPRTQRRLGTTSPAGPRRRAQQPLARCRSVWPAAKASGSLQKRLARCRSVWPAAIELPHRNGPSGDRTGMAFVRRIHRQEECILVDICARLMSSAAKVLCESRLLAYVACAPA
eukprot:1976937-Pleurochrysis_carterae.AAC.2